MVRQLLSEPPLTERVSFATAVAVRVGGTGCALPRQRFARKPDGWARSKHVRKSLHMQLFDFEADQVCSLRRLPRRMNDTQR